MGESRAHAESAFRRFRARWLREYGPHGSTITTRSAGTTVGLRLSTPSLAEAAHHQRYRTPGFVEGCRRTRPMVCFVNLESVDRIICSIFQRFNLEWENPHPRANLHKQLDITVCRGEVDRRVRRVYVSRAKDRVNNRKLRRGSKKRMGVYHDFAALDPNARECSHSHLNGGCSSGAVREAFSGGSSSNNFTPIISSITPLNAPAGGADFDDNSERPASFRFCRFDRELG